MPESRQSVTVRHHPLPWPGQRTIESGNLRQVYCYSKNQENPHEPNYKYTVNIILRDGRIIQLVAAGVDQEQALFIAEIIQKRLILKPHPAVAE
jgi:hypothetical protein